MNCRNFENKDPPYDPWWTEARLGTTYYQAEGLDGETLDATAWFVLFYLPLYPVKRVRLRQDEGNWKPIGTRPRNWASILLLYLQAYLLIPALVALPVIPFSKWFQSILPIPMPVRIVGILCWIAVGLAAASKAMDRHEESFERATRRFA